MAFDGSVITLAGLCEIVLPSHTARICDGGFLDWPARGLFLSEDPVFGTIDSVDAVAEAVSDEAPSGKLTMLPPDLVAAIDLFQPDAQGSPISFWLAEVDPATGLLVGTPESLFSGFVDTLTLRTGRQRREVDIEFMSQAERLFWTKEGNVLSPRFHKTVWPGELGLDFVTGVQTAVPWGIAGPGRGTVTFGGGFDSIIGRYFNSQQMGPINA